MRALLKGKRGPFRDIVLYNAAAAFIVAGKAAGLKRREPRGRVDRYGARGPGAERAG